RYAVSKWPAAVTLARGGAGFEAGSGVRSLPLKGNVGLEIVEVVASTGDAQLAAIPARPPRQDVRADAGRQAAACNMPTGWR
ncbi:MAG: hypothetical protein M3282_07395, partial [Gemmatimonadota bacterium]|nr:hypothetical protein [Gemmatimonadota bacterium]